MPEDPRRVLLVDDDPLMLEARARMLAERRPAWVVQTASSPEAALGLLAEATFDVLVTDDVMPKMNGFELIREIRVAHPAVRTVLTTAVGMGFWGERPRTRPDRVIHWMGGQAEPEAFAVAIESVLRTPSDSGG